MALGSTWWSSTWRNNRLPGTVVFEAATITLSAINTLWNRMSIVGEGLVYQREFHNGGAHDADDGGMFYICNEVTGLLTPAADVFKSSTFNNEFLSAAETSADIEPFDEAQAVRYTSPFCTGGTSFPCDFLVTLTNTPPQSSGDTFVIKHRSPWAWFGSPSQAIASLLLSIGIASTWIDTAAVDTAYDGEEADHGGSGVYKPRILVSRPAGKPIIDTIKRIAAHAWTRIGYTMDGQFACWSATRPTEYAATGLLGIKGRLSWRMTDDHLYNYAEATHGAVNRTTVGGAGVAPTIIDSGKEVANPDYVYRSAWDPTLSSARSDTWLDYDEDTTSQTAYGVIALGGSDEDGVPATLHYELFMDGASPTGVLARVDQFCQPLHEITLEQDFRGMDYEVGTLITDYACADGTTFDAFCVSKEIDFNTLTVTSVLLEDL